MKIRLTGSDIEFKSVMRSLEQNKVHFDSFRKPQKGGNPRYKEGGDKYDPNKGEQLLMYLECDTETLNKMLKKIKI